MAVGFKTWDSSGNLIIDSGTRMSRVIGTAYLTAGSSGSIVDVGFVTGTPDWIVLRPDNVVPGPTLILLPPVISVSGVTLSYSLPSPTPDHILIYGVH